MYKIIIFLVYLTTYKTSIIQAESNGINPRSVAQTVSEIWASKVDTPFKNLQKMLFFQEFSH